MSPHQIAQHLAEKPGAGMRRPRLSVEHEDAQDTPPPKPLAREISSGQAVEPNDQNMVEAPVPSAGAQNRSELAKSYTTAAGAGASASNEGKVQREKNCTPARSGLRKKERHLQERRHLQMRRWSPRTRRMSNRARRRYRKRRTPSLPWPRRLQGSRTLWATAR
eukprot:5415838-Prymnesium_polylepis.1